MHAADCALVDDRAEEGPAAACTRASKCGCDVRFRNGTTATETNNSAKGFLSSKPTSGNGVAAQVLVPRP
eukprot:2824106-Pleurochrysis_carterae.AAC.2